jgi:8-oxo-dGTP diphosphatase
MEKTFKLFVAQKAIIANSENKVLIIREATTYTDGTNIGKWGVPGGRIIPGERIVAGLKREVFEESGLTVEAGAPIHIDEWFPQVREEFWHIVATFRICTIVGEPTVKLSVDHDEYKWIGADEIGQYNIMIEDVRAINAFFELYVK